MSRTMRRFVAVLIVALALSGIFASSAWATLEDTPTPTLGTTKTNPGWGEDSWWRKGWGRSLYPQFSLNPPSVWDPDAGDGYLLGTLYTVDRTMSLHDPDTREVIAGTLVDTTTPNAYYRCAFPVLWADRPLGTNMNNTIDLLGVYLNPPSGSWPVGAPDNLEGQWYLHYSFYSNFRYQSGQYDIPFGIDLTPPTAVSNVSVSSGLVSAPYPQNAWVPTTRGLIKWQNNANYDALSGVGYFQILIDDEPFLPETSSTPAQGRAYQSDAPFVITPDSFMIESLPPGRHKVSVIAVDRATNEGPQGPTCSQYYQSDPDTPTIAWTSPIGNSLVPAMHDISVEATDLAGDPTVTLSLTGGALTPGQITQTMTAPPYSFTPDLSGVANGTYTLTATVSDHLDRTVTLTKTVTWNGAGIASQTTDSSLDVTSTVGLSPDQSRDTTDSRYDHWTNNLFPVVDLPQPANATDVFYNVVQTKTPLDTVNLQNYEHAVLPDGTHLSHIVNLKDSIDAGGPWAPGPAGAVGPYEGTWYFQWVWYDRNHQSVSTTTYPLPFKLDVTPPVAVAGFTATPAAGPWTEMRRAKLSWTAQQYDALSGNAEYRIFLDGEPTISVNATSAMSSSVTIEDMPAGEHVLEIAAVDRAGNVGPKRAVTFRSDPDMPEIAFIEPTSTMTPRRHVVAVEASDDAGDPEVDFSISGGVFGATPVLLATVDAPPYAIEPDFTGVPSGPYTLRATATDPFGHTVTVTQAFFWDATDDLVTDTAVDLADGQGIGTSSSNPSAQDDIDTWWRQGWGNTLTPDFELTPPSPGVDQYGFLVGTLYDVSTSPNDINIAWPDSYFRAARGTGTNLNQTLDMQGIFTYAPFNGSRVPTIAGAEHPIEGPWYLNLVWFTSKGFTSTRTYHIPMGIDLTDPSLVESLTVSPTTNSADATSVIGTSRVHISWKQKEYDALSGVAYFQVVLDGSTVIPDSPTNPAQGRVYNIPGVAPSSVTIEGLEPGVHKIGIQAVDRATNAGKLVEKTIYCDPDVPTISITKPSGSLIGPKPTVAANANDVGGVKSVAFKLDGVAICSQTSAPYSEGADLTGFAAGAHVLTATVTDMFGRTATATKTVTLDKTPLTLSSFSRNYTLFYPIRRDGVRDDLKISFRANKSCYVKVRITTSSGKLVRSINKSVSAGSTSVKWDGKWSEDGKAHTGTFYVQVTATDSAGNSASTSKLKTTIRNYEVVKISGNRVRIVPR